MPIPALLSKLVKKKMLSNAIAMVTSRPGEAVEMKNLRVFDRYVEITCYSEKQVTEYVGKYFNFNKEIQTKALDAIKENKFYLSFGRVPLMCMLMCVYMEHHITCCGECFPETLTAFYSEVVKCMEKKCNKAIQKANLDPASASLVVEKTLDKMAELAGDSLLVGKYTFSEEDLQKLNLSESELTYLKSSSLLFCETSVKKSASSLEVTHEYSFCHTTVQEYFAARHFVKINELPAKTRLSNMTLQFMAGLMNPAIQELLDGIDELEPCDKDPEIGYMEVPVEIRVRGAKAIESYRKALQHGKMKIYRGRIMLVGQKRAGKTSLKKSLLGLPFNPEEESTVGVEVDPSCGCIDVDDVKNWQPTDNTHIVSHFADNVARMMADDLKQVEDNADNIAKAADDVKEVEKQKNLKPVEKSVDIAQNESGYSSQLQQQEEAKTPVHIENEESLLQPEIPRIDKQKNLKPVEKSVDIAQNESGPTSQVQQQEEAKHPIHMENEDSLLQPEIPRIDKPEPEDVPNDVTEKLVQCLKGLALDDSSNEPETIISIWDFAGQHLYYASHPVFMSPRAVYLLVYNLNKDLNAETEPNICQGVAEPLENADQQTNIEALLSWLASIHNIRPTDQKESEDDSKKIPGNRTYLRPPVILVGTNADQPFEDPKKMGRLIINCLSRKSYGQHLFKPFFTVDNTKSSTDEGIQCLQKKINEVLGMEPYMGEHIPLRWHNFEKEIRALVEKKIYHMPLSDLKKIIREVCFMEDPKEIHLMLDFYHDLGVIVRHGDTVVLQTQWLIDLFRKLITVRPYGDQNSMFEEYWNDLEESGILHMALVEHVFSELLDSGQIKEDLLDMMEHYGLIAAFNKVSDNGEVRYFVPAQLRSSPGKLLDIEPSPTGPCALYVYFASGFVPHGFYNLLVSKCIAWCSKNGSPHEPNLFRNASRYIIGNWLFITR